MDASFRGRLLRIAIWLASIDKVAGIIHSNSPGRSIWLDFWTFVFLPPASEGWGKVMFSVCSHLGGGGQVQPAGRGCQVQPVGGGGVRSSRGGGVRSVSWRGGSGQSADKGGGQVSQPKGGGSGPARGGSGPANGGEVSILRPLAGGMPLAFTQADFLVLTSDGSRLCEWGHQGLEGANLLFDQFFRWFKFTLKPPNSITHGNLLSAIWDTSHWNIFVKFGLKTAWHISYDILWSLLTYVNFWQLQGRLSTFAKIRGPQKIKVFSMKERLVVDEAWGLGGQITRLHDGTIFWGCNTLKGCQGPSQKKGIFQDIYDGLKGTQNWPIWPRISP